MQLNKIKYAVFLAMGFSAMTIVGCSKQETPQEYAVQYAKDHPDEYIQQQAAQQYAPQPQQQVQQQPQVVYEQAPTQYVQSAPVQSSGGSNGTDMLAAGAVGMLAGHMLSGGGHGYGGGGYSNHTVVNHTTIVNHAPTPAPRVNTYRPSPIRSSSFGSSRSFSRRR